MAKLCYLLLLLCATAQATNAPSRLAQEYSDELSETSDAETVGPSCQEPSQTNGKVGLLCRPDDTAPVTEALIPEDTTPVTEALIPDDTTPVTDASSRTGMLGRLDPDVMARIGFNLPLSEAIGLTKLHPDIKVHYTPEQRETMKAIEQRKFLNKFIFYNDVETMDETLAPILIDKGIFYKHNAHQAINTARLRMDEIGATTDDDLATTLEQLQYFPYPELSERRIKIKQAVEVARQTIDEHVAPEVRYYNDDESMDSEINALLDNLTLDERAIFSETLLAVQRDVPLADEFAHMYEATFSSAKFRHALEMQIIVAEARNEVMLAKKRLRRSEMAEFHGGRLMTEALTRMLEGTMDGQAVQDVMADARWTVLIRIAIRYRKMTMVHKLLSFKFRRSRLERRLLASAVQEDDTDILKIMLESTGSTANYEYALRIAVFFASRVKPLGVKALEFLLADERATSTFARVFLVQGIKSALKRNTYGTADLILKSGRLVEPELSAMKELYSDAILP